MNLEELVDNSRTDKNTRHSYLELYQKLLNDKRNTAQNVLEVGIDLGGSIKLWHDFFTNATIYALDVMEMKDVWDEIQNKERIKLYTPMDAYNEEYFNGNFLNKGIKCDVLLDDGPHSLQSMLFFIQLYSKIMTDDGILIVEDIQHWDWVENLKEAVPEHLKPFIEVYDLRENKGRYDDIVFTINKSKK